MEQVIEDPKSAGDAISSLKLNTEPVQASCNKCEKPMGEMVLPFGYVTCDDCVAKWEEENRLEQIKPWWKNFCPKLYRETDVNHEDYKRVWPLVAGHADPKQNLIFAGSSGTCKSRCMMQRLKICLFKGLSVDVLWADALDDAIESRKQSKLRERCLEPSVLGIDDFLTSGSSLEGVTKFLKGLLDIRLRDGKATIITTNLMARDIESDSEKFGNATKADQQRVQAIIRRLRGEFKTVDFDAGLGDGKF